MGAPVKAQGVQPPAQDSTEKIREVTVEGYTFKFDADKIDDVEVIEMAAEIEQGQVARIIDFVKFLIGDEAYAEMKNFYVTQDGKFKLTTLMAVFKAVFEKFDPKG